MSKLYKKVEKLCKDNETNITAMCKKIGISRGSMSDLKHGRIRTISVDSIEKIANYFEISMDYLLGTEKEPYVIPPKCLF